MWIIIVIVILLLLIVGWLLLTPLELQIDTRTPQASLRWVTIGNVIVVYENEKWLLRLRVLFFHKQWELEKIIFAKKKKKKRAKPIRKKRKSGLNKLKKFVGAIKTFRITKWEIAIDTGDVIKNAWLYPLNFSPGTQKHLHINFLEENYLVLTIRNTPWRLAYAFLR